MHVVLFEMLDNPDRHVNWVEGNLYMTKEMLNVRPCQLLL